jgi:hypothetical protein
VKAGVVVRTKAVEETYKPILEDISYYNFGKDDGKTDGTYD